MKILRKFGRQRIWTPGEDKFLIEAIEEDRSYISIGKFLSINPSVCKFRHEILLQEAVQKEDKANPQINKAVTFLRRCDFKVYKTDGGFVVDSKTLTGTELISKAAKVKKNNEILYI